MCIDLDNGEVNTQGYSCEWYWQAYGECDYMNTDTFNARDMCCACYGGLNETLGHEGDDCLGWDETTQRAFPDCRSGLTCEQQDAATDSGNFYICVAEEEDEEHYYASEDEECGYYSDSLGYDVECDSGLTCVDQSGDTDVVYMTCVVYEEPTDYDGIGVDSDYNTLGYWYLNEDQTENSGHYVTSDGQYTGVWNYDEDSTLSGTWMQDDG